MWLLFRCHQLGRYLTLRKSFLDHFMRLYNHSVDPCAGVIETWEFLGSFREVLALPRVPALADLEASLADPGAGGGAAERAAMALVLLVAEEAFAAAAAVAAEADPDVRLRDLESAFPVIRVRRTMVPWPIGCTTCAQHGVCMHRGALNEGIRSYICCWQRGTMACFRWWSLIWLPFGHMLLTHFSASTTLPASTHMLTQEGTWAEVARRLFALGAAAAHVRAGEGSGGLDPALGPNLGSSPLAALGPAVVLQFLAAGPASPDPRTSVAALPLVRPALPLPRAQPFACSLLVALSWAVQH